MKVKPIYPNLYLYTFPNQYELCSTFIRLQEYYESPYKEIRRKYFRLDQYMDLYAKDQEGNKFTYFEDWNGFNVPGHIVDLFMRVFSSDLSKRELTLLNQLPDLCDEKYYVIGTVEGEIDTIKHEVAHGLYYLNKEYKKKMNKLINNMPIPLRKKAEKSLIELGYCKAVLKDELQAYFATGIDKGIIPDWYKVIYCNYITKIKKVFKEHSHFIVLNAKG